MSDQIRVNGNILSWGSIFVTIDGNPYFGFTGVTYGDKRERVKQYGMGQHQAPRARSRGKYTVDPVKLTGPPSSLMALRGALASRAVDGVSYGNTECEIHVQYFDTFDTSITVVLSRCVWSAESQNDEESPDPLKAEAEFDCMKITRNGLTLFDSSNGAP